MIPHPSQRFRTRLSITLLVFQAALAVGHVIPGLIIPRSGAATTAAVAALQAVGPVWVTLYGVTALWLGCGLALGWRMRHAHLASAAVLVGYDSALIYGAVVTHGTVGYPLAIFALLVVNTLMAGWYNETDGREARP